MCRVPFSCVNKFFIAKRIQICLKSRQINNCLLTFLYFRAATFQAFQYEDYKHIIDIAMSVALFPLKVILIALDLLVSLKTMKMLLLVLNLLFCKRKIKKERVNPFRVLNHMFLFCYRYHPNIWMGETSPCLIQSNTTPLDPHR